MLTPSNRGMLLRDMKKSARPRETGMKECSDAVLVKNIAREQDRASFDELYKRLEQPAFSLAMQITHCRETAMEAVQEAMLRVWISAGQFDEERNARGWIFRIVVREGIRLSQLTRGDARRRAKKSAQATREQRLLIEGIAQKEELEGLRKGMEQLPELSRRLLTLYYSVGMSQREIAQAVSLSQRSVSNKLEESITFLRSQLKRSGLASAIPLLSEEALSGGTFGEALLSMYAVPDELKTEVYKNLGTRRNSPVALKQWLLISVLLIGGLAFAAFFRLRSNGFFASNSMKQSNSQTSAAIQKGTQLTQAGEKLLRVEWTFENGPPNDIELKHDGDWNWEAAKGRNPAFVKMPPSDVGMLLLPQHLSKKPHVITVEVYTYKIGSSSFFPAWSTATGVSASREVFNTFKRKKGDHKKIAFKIRYRAYIHGKFIFVEHSERVVHVFWYENEQHGDQICLAIRNWRIHRITLEEIEEQDIPVAIRNPEDYLRKYKGKNYRSFSYKFKR